MGDGGSPSSRTRRVSCARSAVDTDGDADGSALVYLFRFVAETLAPLDGVPGWSSNVELLTLKRGFVQTPWWRAEAGSLLS